MFSERGQRIPGWAPVKQWTEGPTRFASAARSQPPCIVWMNKSNAIAGRWSRPFPKARRELRPQRACLGNRSHPIPSAPRPAVPGRCAAPALPSGYAAATPSTRRASHHNRNGQPYSMTWSATASSLSGTLRPSDFAALRLMTSSYLIGCWIGRSVSLAPLRMRSMYPAAWRSSSEKSAL